MVNIVGIQIILHEVSPVEGTPFSNMPLASQFQTFLVPVVPHTACPHTDTRPVSLTPRPERSDREVRVLSLLGDEESDLW